MTQNWLQLIEMSFRSSKLHMVSAKWSAGACSVSKMCMQYVKICTYEIIICCNGWELYRRWSHWAEAAAAGMLVMVVSCQSRQRSAGTRRVTPDEVEWTHEDVWRWTEVTSCLDNGLWKLELGGVCSSRRSWGLDLRTERPWPSLDWHW